MLRSAIVAGADRGVVKYWAQRYHRSGAPPDVKEILSAERILDQARSLLSLEELSVINATEIQGLNAGQVEFVLRSQIQRASSSDRAQIIRWTKEMKKLCQGEIPS